jgi:hypothetical protein
VGGCFKTRGAAANTSDWVGLGLGCVRRALPRLAVVSEGAEPCPGRSVGGRSNGTHGMVAHLPTVGWFGGGLMGGLVGGGWVVGGKHYEWSECDGWGLMV